jgi:hypothetical protein
MMLNSVTRRARRGRRKRRKEVRSVWGVSISGVSASSAPSVSRCCRSFLDRMHHDASRIASSSAQRAYSDSTLRPASSYAEITAETRSGHLL